MCLELTDKVLIFAQQSESEARIVLKIFAVLSCTSGYATWFTAGGAIRIAHYDVIDDVITRQL